MKFIIQPWQVFFLILSGLVNREQQRAIDYLRTENQVLRELAGKKRILLNDDQRRRLAVMGKLLGRKGLEQVATLVTPDTILRWHRRLVAEKWDHSEKRKSVGRPPVSNEIEELVLRMADENPTWGYDRIQGALANLGHAVSDTTIGNILKAHGIEPAPSRKRSTSWATFLKAHWEVLSAIDFTTVEVWTKTGLTTFYLLFVMELRTRRVHFAGCTPNPNEPWMKQVAKNLTDAESGFLNGAKYLLTDRDGKFTPAFRATLQQAGVEPVLLPPRSPNLNAHIERFMGSLKAECLDRMIFFGENPLRKAVAEFLLHYHAERNHQGLGNRLIEPPQDLGKTSGTLECRERLAGLLRYYYRKAA